MKTKILFSSAIALLVLLNLTSVKAQFQQLTPPCNAPGFKTVRIGNAFFQNEVIIQQPGYPGYISSDGGVNWIEMQRGIYHTFPMNCGFLASDSVYESIDLKKGYFTPPVSCENQYLMAVGQHGKLIQSFDLGYTWTNMPLDPLAQIPNNAEFIDCDVNKDGCKVSCAVTKQGYAIFWDGNCTCAPYYFGQVNLNSTINACLESSSAYPYFCGENGKLFIPSSFSSNPVYTEIPTGTQENLLAGISIGEDIYVCGNSGTLIKIYYQNGNLNYSQADLSNLYPNGKYPDFNAMAVAPASQGGGIYVVGGNGTLLKSLDQGSTWSSEITGTNASLRGIDINETAIYIVGENSTILKKLW